MGMLLLVLTLAQDLTEATYERYRDAIPPSAAECAWEKIGWHQTLWDAALQAQKESKPILLFAMNGHPCGHT